MPYDDNNSAYIQPFLPPNRDLQKGMDEYIMQKPPLSSDKKRLEGMVMPYHKDNNDYIKRR